MKVTWNSDSYAQFLQPTFDIKPDLKITLLDDFTSLKQGMCPAVFGKDGPYTAPGAIVSSRVYHVHLLFTKQERTSSRNRFNCTSDRALVYSQHAHFQDVYSLTTHSSMRKIQKLWPISLHTPLHFKRSLIRDNPANKTSEFKYPPLNDSIPIKYGIIVQNRLFYG